MVYSGDIVDGLVERCVTIAHERSPWQTTHDDLRLAVGPASGGGGWRGELPRSYAAICPRWKNFGLVGCTAGASNDGPAPPRRRAAGSWLQNLELASLSGGPPDRKNDTIFQTLPMMPDAVCEDHVVARIGKGHASVQAGERQCKSAAHE